MKENCEYSGIFQSLIEPSLTLQKILRHSRTFQNILFGSFWISDDSRTFWSVLATSKLDSQQLHLLPLRSVSVRCSLLILTSPNTTPGVSNRKLLYRWGKTGTIFFAVIAARKDKSRLHLLYTREFQIHGTNIKDWHRIHRHTQYIRSYNHLLYRNL